jgi:succinate dehydrogenase / fumarate reductase cytochrome b subunit
MLLFVGPEAFNAYGEFMGTNPIIRTMEVVLFLGILGHIGYSINVTLQNRKARPVQYTMKADSATSSWYSRYMIVSGTILLVFMVLHLIHFWVDQRFLAVKPELYGEVEKTLSNPVNSGIYLVALVFLGMHLVHGFQSAFQTFGLQINKGSGKIFNSISIVFAIVVTAGFMAMPLYFLLKA